MPTWINAPSKRSAWGFFAISLPKKTKYIGLIEIKQQCSFWYFPLCSLSHLAIRECQDNYPDSWLYTMWPVSCCGKQLQMIPLGNPGPLSSNHTICGFALPQYQWCFCGNLAQVKAAGLNPGLDPAQTKDSCALCFQRRNYPLKRPLHLQESWSPQGKAMQGRYIALMICWRWDSTGYTSLNILTSEGLQAPHESLVSVVLYCLISRGMNAFTDL